MKRRFFHLVALAFAFVSPLWAEQGSPSEGLRVSWMYRDPSTGAVIADVSMGPDGRFRGVYYFKPSVDSSGREILVPSHLALGFNQTGTGGRFNRIIESQYPISDLSQEKFPVKGIDCLNRRDDGGCLGLQISCGDRNLNFRDASNQTEVLRQISDAFARAPKNGAEDRLGFRSTFAQKFTVSGFRDAQGRRIFMQQFHFPKADTDSIGYGARMFIEKESGKFVEHEAVKGNLDEGFEAMELLPNGKLATGKETIHFKLPSKGPLTTGPEGNEKSLTRLSSDELNRELGKLKLPNLGSFPCDPISKGAVTQTQQGAPQTASSAPNATAAPGSTQATQTTHSTPSNQGGRPVATTQTTTVALSTAEAWRRAGGRVEDGFPVLTGGPTPLPLVSGEIYKSGNNLWRFNVNRGFSLVGTLPQRTVSRASVATAGSLARFGSAAPFNARLGQRLLIPRRQVFIRRR